MPLSALNQMRREATDRLAQLKTIGRPIPNYKMPKYPVLPDALEPKLPEDILILPSITKGKEDAWIAENMTASSVLVNNLGWIEEFLAKR